MPSILNATTTNGLVTSADNSGSLQLQTNNGTTAVTIDTSQNVLVGTTTADNKLTVSSSSSGSAAGVLSLVNPNDATNTASDLDFVTHSSGTLATGRIRGLVAGADNYPMSFWTYSSGGLAERMRIDSSGNLLVGSTARVNGGWVGGYIQSVGYAARSGTSGSFSGNAFNINWTGNANLWIDSTNIGQFSFVSDYRIKRNIQTQTQPALERVMQLRPVTYQMADYGNLFKASDEIKEGFIAHEVQEVIPSGVDGEKDAENQIQSLRVDAILAVAVKAIQEQQAQIEELKAKVSALEGVK